MQHYHILRAKPLAASSTGDCRHGAIRRRVWESPVLAHLDPIESILYLGSRRKYFKHAHVCKVTGDSIRVRDLPLVSEPPNLRGSTHAKVLLEPIENLVDCGVVIGFPNGSIFLFGCPSGKIAAGVLESCINVFCKLGIVVDEITLRGVPLAPEMMIAHKGIEPIDRLTPIDFLDIVFRGVETDVGGGAKDFQDGLVWVGQFGQHLIETAYMVPYGGSSGSHSWKRGQVPKP